MLLAPMLFTIMSSERRAEKLVILAGGGIWALWGDLWYSAAKRAQGKKDYAHILPGHGGILDRLDSHLNVWLVSLII